MKELNKYILLVMKWLNDKSSVTKEELRKNAYAAAADYADATAYAAAAASAAYATAYAEKWINKYFERTGENKQDYLDALEADKVGEWMPVVGEECLAIDTHHGDIVVTPLVSDEKEGVIVCKSDFGYDGYSQFHPLKTAEEKEREAFYIAIYKELGKIELDLDCVGDRKRKEKAIANIMFKAGFKAPEGAK